MPGSSLAERVSRLGTAMGIGALDIGSRGLVEVTFDGDLAVTFELVPGGDELLLHAVLASVNAGANPGALFAAMLAANHPDAGASAEALAIDPMTQEAVIYRRIGSAECAREEDLPAFVRAFVARARAVRETLAREGAGAEGESAPAREDALSLQAHFLRV